MKIQNIFLHLTMLSFVLTVASCTKSTESKPPSTVPTVQASSTLPVTVAIATPSNLPTLTLIPTLTVEDARKRLLELLANNGDCQLPCLWSITPGKSTYQEAQAIFTPLSSVSDLTSFSPTGGAIFPVYIEGDAWLDIDVGFSADTLSSNVVSKISFRARELQKIITTDGSLGFEPVFDSSLFGERVSVYMLHTVLTKYGLPELVILGTVASIPPREPPGGFHILLLYPEQGIMINYTTQIHKSGIYVSGCPANAHIEMDLYPPGNSDAFFASLEKSDDWAVKKNWYKPLEEATSISVDEFYETFREPNDKCIETLASLWPIPEP